MESEEGERVKPTKKKKKAETEVENKYQAPIVEHREPAQTGAKERG